MSDEKLTQIDNRLQNIEAICERTAQNIDALTHQVGLIAEGQTAFRENLARLETIVDRQAATSERQERHIDRLVGIVETLVSGRAS